MQQHLEALQHELGVPLFLVGGMVRDSLLGKEPKDWDLTCPMDPNLMFETLQRSGYHVLPTGLQHGTISVVFEEGIVEITAHRSEGEYEDGRRPSEVSYQDVSLEQDLSRRDFTINSMALSLDGKLVDPFGGQEDLDRKLIRAVGDPLKRFTEDGLRPMRACRFMSQLGFDLDPRTAQAIPITLHVFNKVAKERILTEFTKLLQGKNPFPALRLMTKTGLLATWIPETLEETPGARVMGEAIKCSTLLSRLVVFFRPLRQRPDFGDILIRCKFSSEVISKIIRLGELDVPFEYGDSAKMDGRLRKVMSRLEEKNILLEDWLTLPYNSILKSRMLRALEGRPPLHIKDLAIKGEDLLQLFPLKPGPWMSHALKSLLEMVLERPELNNLETLSQIVKTLHLEGTHV